MHIQEQYMFFNAIYMHQLLSLTAKNSSAFSFSVISFASLKLCSVASYKKFLCKFLVPWKVGELVATEFGVWSLEFGVWSFFFLATLSRLHWTLRSLERSILFSFTVLNACVKFRLDPWVLEGLCLGCHNSHCAAIATHLIRHLQLFQ